MMPGSKGLNPHELAHKWMKELGSRPDMRISGRLWEREARSNLWHHIKIKYGESEYE